MLADLTCLSPARVVLLYWRGEGILGPGGYRQIAADPSYKKSLLPAAKLYCAPTLNSLSNLYGDQKLPIMMWENIAVATKTSGSKLQIVGCHNTTCEKHMDAASPGVKSRCGTCKVAMWASSCFV